MLVMKFGGTSVGNAKNIAAVCRIVKNHLRQRPVVVVSAVTKMTDALIELAKSQVSPHSRPLPQGERKSHLTPTLSSEERESVIVFQKIKQTHAAIVEELRLPHDLLKAEFEELARLMVKVGIQKPFSVSSRARLRDLPYASSRGDLSTPPTAVGVGRDDNKADVNVKRLDHFQSFGERMSAKIVAAQLEKIGVAAHAFPAWEIGMITDDRFGSAEPLPSAAKIIRRRIQALRSSPTSFLPLRGRGRKRKEGDLTGGVPVVTGFIGKTAKGEITTLGRGGSDYSAAIIGAAIGAKSIQIWTDVDGVMTADPRIVPDARIVRELAFEEACELAYFGAKVLHPKTILPAIEKNIPVQVLNSFNPQGKGTTIVRTFAQRRQRSRSVEAFACKKGITIVHLRSLGFFDGNELMERIFILLRQQKTAIDLVAISVAGLAFAIDKTDGLDKIVKELGALGQVTVVRGKAIICAVGGSINAAGVSGKMFSALGRARIPVEMISQAAGGVSMTFAVDEKDAEKAMRVLHREHFGR